MTDHLRITLSIDRDAARLKDSITHQLGRYLSHLVRGEYEAECVRELVGYGIHASIEDAGEQGDEEPRDVARMRAWGMM